MKNFIENILRGIATINIFGTDRHTEIMSDEEAMKHDRDALYSDWNKIGDDFRNILNK